MHIQIGSDRIDEYNQALSYPTLLSSQEKLSRVPYHGAF